MNRIFKKTLIRIVRQKTELKYVLIIKKNYKRNDKKFFLKFIFK